MQLNGENSTEASRLLDNTQSSYQSRDDYDWNVEIDVKGQVSTGPEEEFTRFSFKKLLQYTGPGWLMAIAYLDPGNLESDLQAGSVAGYKLLWLLFWAHAAGLAIQILSLRLGVVTQNHLAQLIRRNYSRPSSIAIWLFTQCAIIGSDIQEIIGTAIALKILFRLELWVGVMITATDTFFFMWLQQYGVRKIEVFFMTLIGVMTVCFWLEMFASHPSVDMILRGILVPEIPAEATTQAVAVIGCVIMNHNMFLHSALVMSRSLGTTPTENKKREANFYFAIESTISLLVSYLINLAVVVVFAQVFYKPGQPITQLPGLYDASKVLSNTLGKSAKYFWALGLLASGQCSTMTGTLAGQYVVEGFFGAIFKKQWHRVALTRAVALVPSMLVAVLAVDRFDTMGEFLNVLQSLCLPTAVIPILKLTASQRVMTKVFQNSMIANIVCWAISFIVIGFNVRLVIDYMDELQWPLYAMVLCVVYFSFILYLIYKPLEIPVDTKEMDRVAVLEQDL